MANKKCSSDPDTVRAIQLPQVLVRHAARGYGLDFGYRGGRGPYRGWPWSGYGYGGPFVGPARKQQRDILQERVAYLEDALKDVKQRIAEIEMERKTK